MNHPSILITLILLIVPSVGFSNTTFEVVQGEDENKLVVTDQVTGKSFDGEANRFINIETIQDFNEDGIDDALISSSMGGNCCPAEYSVVTLKNNSLKSVNFNADWSEITAIDENGKHLIQEKTKEKTNIYSFNGEKLVLVKTIPKLQALKEVFGPGGQSAEDRKAETLVFDINNDGKKEKIVCPVWERWGSLTCIVPVPNKEDQQLDIGCDRFGVLKSMNNGFHEFVCNNDIIITFNGTKWVDKSSGK